MFLVGVEVIVGCVFSTVFSRGAHQVMMRWKYKTVGFLETLFVVTA